MERADSLEDLGALGPSARGQRPSKEDEMMDKKAARCAAVRAAARRVWAELPSEDGTISRAGFERLAEIVGGPLDWDDVAWAEEAYADEAQRDPRCAVSRSRRHRRLRDEESEP